MKPELTTVERRARVFGSAGARAREVGMVRVTWPILLLALAVGYALGHAIPFPGLAGVTSGFVLVIFVVLLARFMNRARAQLENYLEGARGEERVSYHLAALPGDFLVFNSLHPGRASGHGTGDIDHVVVGPTGVFAVETKSWPGIISIRDNVVLLDGQPGYSDAIAQARASARALTDWVHIHTGLSIEVHPVLCFAAGRLSGGERGTCGDVAVHTLESLSNFLLKPMSPLPNPDLIEQVGRFVTEQIKIKKAPAHE